MSHGGELLNDYSFTVVIDGMDQLHFSEVSGLSVEVGVVEFRSGADADTVGRVVPGRVKYGPVKLKRGVARDLRSEPETGEHARQHPERGAGVSGVERPRWRPHSPGAGAAAAGALCAYRLMRTDSSPSVISISAMPDSSSSSISFFTFLMSIIFPRHAGWRL